MLELAAVAGAEPQEEVFTLEYFQQLTPFTDHHIHHNMARQFLRDKYELKESTFCSFMMPCQKQYIRSCGSPPYGEGHGVGLRERGRYNVVLTRDGGSCLHG